MTVKENDTVTVHYTGMLEDGSVFDSSEGKDPIEFKVGEGKVIKGFENAIKGMKKDEEKTVKISPEEGYGNSNAGMQQWVPREMFGDKFEPKVGLGIALKLPDGKALPAIIKSIEEKRILLDMNNPLAGKTLTFKVKVVDIK